MLSIFDFARDMSFLAICLRMICAVICGGLVGIEREIKRRPAGFRTHILICLGASITTLTSQYLYLSLNLYTDIARLGAQVISGIGFIGAGAIIVTKSKKIKGLTTAAGLWASAIIGLVCGAGYIECAIVATAMILFAEIILSKLEFRISRNNRNVQLYVEYVQTDAIEKIISHLRFNGIIISDLEITRADNSNGTYHYCALIHIQGNNRVINDELLDNIRNITYVKIVDQL